MQPNPDQSKSSLFTIGADRTLKAFNQPSAGAVQTYNPGSILDNKYEVVSQIGEGGMGAVFCVKHLMLGKEVALKTFLTTDFSDEAKIRFQREAQAIARLSHVSIVQVFDYGLIGGGIPYYTMEYLRGESLADRIKASGALNLEEALAIFLQVSQGLALAHSKGIIHRDLKPANLFLVGGMSATASGAIKIMDFGIASVSASPYAGTPDQRLTVVGAVFGSPLYMSPEQSLGQTVTERSDIYSLGSSLFETLTGRPPFLGKTAAETIMMHHSQAAPSLYDASGGKVFPSAVERMVATMLERRPELRQPSVQQLIGALQNALRGAKKKSIMMAMPDLEKRLTAGGSGPSVPDFKDQEVESNANGKSRGLGSGRRKALLLSLCGLCLVGLLAAVLCLQSPPSKSPPVVSDASSSSSYLEKPSSEIESLPDCQGYAEMHFPNQQSIGRIVSLKNGAVISEGAGFLHWPLASLPCFMPSGDFVANGSNWQFLPSNSVNGIVVDICPPARDLPKLYEAVLHQQNLSKFELDGNGPDQSLVAVLDKLPSLRQLCLSDSTVPPVALAQYKGWQYLNNFVYCNSGDASMLLDRLKNSKNLVSLTVVGTHLNNADVKNIASCPNIDALTLTDTGFSDNDLRQLLPLKELFSLHVADCPVTSASTNTLKIMASRHLRKLTLNRGAWTDGQLATLKQAGIKVCLADEASNIDLDRNHDLNEIILQDVDDAKNDK